MWLVSVRETDVCVREQEQDNCLMDHAVDLSEIVSLWLLFTWFNQELLLRGFIMFYFVSLWIIDY